MTATVDKKKKFPLWYEPFDGISRVDDEFHKMMGRMSFQVPKMNIDFPKILPVFISEKERELILNAELPGFSKEEVRLKVTPTTVSISAEKSKIAIEKNDAFYRQERSFGSANRVMTLPSEINTEDVKARFQNGVLEVVLPKKDTRKSVERDIKVR